MDPQRLPLHVERAESRSVAYRWLHVWAEWHATGTVPGHAAAVRAIASFESSDLQIRATDLRPSAEREDLLRKARALRAVAELPGRWAGFDLPLR